MISSLLPAGDFCGLAPKNHAQLVAFAFFTRPKASSSKMMD
jgi:hypothetical protein